MTRILFALAAVAIGCFVAIAVGAPANIVLIVAGTGLAALLLALSPAETYAPQRFDERSESTTSPLPIEDHPAFRAIIAATPDPILIVRSGRVTAANDAAREWLGDYIVGSDVRTAIRHPAAA